MHGIDLAAEAARGSSVWAPQHKNPIFRGCPPLQLESDLPADGLLPVLWIEAARGAQPEETEGWCARGAPHGPFAHRSSAFWSVFVSPFYLFPQCRSLGGSLLGIREATNSGWRTNRRLCGKLAGLGWSFDVLLRWVVWRDLNLMNVVTQGNNSWTWLFFAFGSYG